MNAMRFEPIAGLDIAIVGMSCRVPGADSYEEYWRNLREGRESISRFSADELIERGVPEDIVADPAYVRAGGVLENADAFDAAYFRISPRESGITDPQHRVFLECSVAALEDAGYDPGRVPGYVGVFAGAGTNAHLLELMSDPATMAAVDGMELIIGNDKDYLATRTSYKLGLRGPSITVQTACSTSLVAVHLACQSLSSFECDMAIAGGVSISVRHRLGYLYQEGGIASPDGRCRPFDAAANGTVGGSGVGLVVLQSAHRGKLIAVTYPSAAEIAVHQDVVAHGYLKRRPSVKIVAIDPVTRDREIIEGNRALGIEGGLRATATEIEEQAVRHHAERNVRVEQVVDLVLAALLVAVRVHSVRDVSSELRRVLGIRESRAKQQNVGRLLTDWRERHIVSVGHADRYGRLELARPGRARDCNQAEPTESGRHQRPARARLNVGGLGIKCHRARAIVLVKLRG